jgi:phage antirepressor YoqD-like protein
MNDLITTEQSAPVTMSSLELVEVINSMRGPDAAELRHTTFMEKVKKVLKEDAQKFLSIYLDAYGREKPCYRFPKREANLMVMSESYAVQAAVYDRMEALEAHVARPQLPDFTKPAVAARAWAEQFEQREQAQALADKRKEVIDAQREHVEFSLAVDVPENSLDLGEFASLLARQNFKIGRQRLVDLFLEDGYLTRTGRELRPTAYAKERDWIVLVYPTPCGDFPVRAQAFVTVKGQKYFIDKYITKPAKESARIAKRYADAEPKRIEDSRAQKQRGGLFDKTKHAD